MPDFLPAYGRTAGPLGVPCTDEQAFDLDRICRGLDEPEVKRLHVPAAVAAMDGDRTDESWVSTEDPDRVGDVVLARGMDPGHFLKNPVVPLNHAYWLPPVGHCLRLWQDRSDSANGIKALTKYPPKPENHAGDWPSEDVWQMVKAGLLVGKSIGLLPTQKRTPTEAEARRGVKRVIEKWILLEYSVTGLTAAVPMGVGTPKPAGAVPVRRRFRFLHRPR